MYNDGVEVKWNNDFKGFIGYCRYSYIVIDRCECLKMGDYVV